MELKFTVHNPHTATIGKHVMLADGEQVRAAVDCFEAELVPADGASGVLKLRVMGAKASEAAAQFLADHVVTFSVASVDAPAAEVAAAA